MNKDKENLLTLAISDIISCGTYVFSAEQMLIVASKDTNKDIIDRIKADMLQAYSSEQMLQIANIDIEELNKIKDKFGNKADEIVKYFKADAESRCTVNGN